MLYDGLPLVEELDNHRKVLSWIGCLDACTDEALDIRNDVKMTYFSIHQLSLSLGTVNLPSAYLFCKIIVSFLPVQCHLYLGIVRHVEKYNKKPIDISFFVKIKAF